MIDHRTRDQRFILIWGVQLIVGNVGLTGKSGFKSADWDSGRSAERAGASASAPIVGHSKRSLRHLKVAIQSFGTRSGHPLDE